MPEKLTTKIFIERSILINGDRYDYSLVDYKGNKIKVKIICPDHGVFEQTPNHHLKGQGCPKCGNKTTAFKRSLNIGTFINRSNKAHEGKYDYSLSEYVDNHTKVKIICPDHGIFEQIPKDHLNGHGCPDCGSKKSQNTTELFINKSNIKYNYKYDYSETCYTDYNTKVKIICPEHGVFEQTPQYHLKGKGCPGCAGIEKITTKIFIKKSNLVHEGKYDYSLSDYKDSNTKIKIICPEHGVFEQIPYSHLMGHGCPECVGLKKLTINIFRERSTKIHNGKYDYSESDYLGGRIKTKIICPKHGPFFQDPVEHLVGHGCPVCSESHKERETAIYLNTNKIKYEREKKFEGCRNKYILFFDFWLPDLNICIEVDGIQHFKPIKYFGGEKTFKDTQKRDLIKTNFCNNTDKKLIRISYKDDLQEILDKEVLSLIIS